MVVNKMSQPQFTLVLKSELRLAYTTMQEVVDFWDNLKYKIILFIMWSFYEMVLFLRSTIYEIDLYIEWSYFYFVFSWDCLSNEDV